MSDRVLLTIKDGVADIRYPTNSTASTCLCLSPGRNRQAHLAADRSLRAVVLSAEGRGFCAGLDFMSFMAPSEGPKRNLFERSAESAANLAQRAAFIWAEVPIPATPPRCTLSAFGGGIQIAPAADLRIVAPDARAVGDGDQVGTHPHISATQNVPAGFFSDVAKELTFSRWIVSGIEVSRSNR